MKAIFVVYIMSVLSLFAGDPLGSSIPINVFKDRLSPAPVGGSFRMEDYIVWGGSVVSGDDGRYYMFASRWPKETTMRNWVSNSEVVLASADTPEGPYQFEKVVLPQRGSRVLGRDDDA